MSKKYGTKINLETGWIRLELFLPINTPKEQRAVQHIRDKFHSNFHGSTHSVTKPPVFRGWYKSRKTGRFLADNICTMIVLSEGDLEQKSQERQFQRVLKYVEEEYKNADSPQEEIWMLANSSNHFSLVSSENNAG